MSENPSGAPGTPPNGANGAPLTPPDAIDGSGWEHVAGGKRSSLPTVYRLRWEEPPGYLVAVGSSSLFIPDEPHQMIAEVLAQVAELVAASPAARAPGPAKRPPPPPRPGGGPNIVQTSHAPQRASHVQGAPSPQRAFPGEAPWPGQIPMGGGGQGGIPLYMADPAMRSKFAGGLAKRLDMMPPALNGWQSIAKIIGPQPRQMKPGLWTLFPGLGGAPEGDPGRMLTAAIAVFSEMGHHVENDHVWVGKPGQQ